MGSGRALAQGKPVYVSPITFKMRHNPYATAAAPPTPPGQLPSQVDPRQMSLFAACWTAASMKHVAEAGAAGITYFETTGSRGVMETAAGSPVPDKFVSIPAGVYPAYHVFADVGEFSGGQVISSRSADRLAVDGLALRKDGKLRVLVANMTAEPQTVVVRGLPARTRRTRVSTPRTPRPRCRRRKRSGLRPAGAWPQPTARSRWTCHPTPWRGRTRNGENRTQIYLIDLIFQSDPGGWPDKKSTISVNLRYLRHLRSTRGRRRSMKTGLIICGPDVAYGPLALLSGTFEEKAPRRLSWATTASS